MPDRLNPSKLQEYATRQFSLGAHALWFVLMFTLFLIPSPGCSLIADFPDPEGEVCGDGTCSPGESPATCPEDCSPETCGNGILEGGEECDDGNTEDGDGCSATCHLEPETCGNGTCDADETEATCPEDCPPELCGNNAIDPGEECDESNLDGQSCVDLGFASGTLDCDTNCQFDVSGCTNCNSDNVCQPGTGETSANCPQDCSWIDISCGETHTCALKIDGSAWCWGKNEDYQLGDGTDTDAPFPVPVATLQNVTELALGGAHTCGRKTDGTVYCWGENFHGQVGNGSADYHIETPQAVDSSDHYSHITAGGFHTCAIRDTDGIAFCWGENASGQLGTDDLNEYRSPEEVHGSLTFTAISAGSEHTCGVNSNGDEVLCWGHGGGGRLGHGFTSGSDVPVGVDSTDTFHSVSLGGMHSCAIDFQKDAYCWGKNSSDQLGIPSVDPHTTVPELVQNVGTNGVDSIAAGGTHTCAVENLIYDVYCWGDNSNGQLGDGTNTNRDTATPVPFFTGNVTKICAGSDHTCALTTDGRLYCWGYNFYGQLGDGTNSETNTPVQVVDP